MKAYLVSWMKAFFKKFYHEQFQRSGMKYSPGPALGLLQIIKLVGKSKTFPEISAGWLHRKILRKEELLLLDVRAAEAFEKNHIQKSINVPLRELLLSETLPFSREVEIITICYMGVTSREVISYLRELGYLNVKNLRGGMGAWSFGGVSNNEEKK